MVLGLGRDARIGGDLREIAAGDVVGAEAVIEHAELELDARRVRRVDKHALEGGDGALVVAGRGGQLGVFEGEIEIVGTRQHLLEQDLAARLGLLVRSGKAGPSAAHNKSGNRDGDRQLCPQPHNDPVRPFREAFAGRACNVRPIPRKR